MKKRFCQILLSAGLMMSTALSAQINWGALEEKDPVNFQGFKSTNFEAARQYAEANPSTEVPFVSMGLVELSQKLGAFPELAPIKEDLEAFLQRNPNIPAEDEPYYALYYVGRLLLVQDFDSEQMKDEKDFFKLAGFPHTYKHLNVLKTLSALQPDKATISQVIRVIRDADKADMAEENTRGESYTRATHAAFMGAEAVDKALKACNDTVVLLPGEDMLGFFYLAYVYAQGVHPIPMPFRSETVELHGVALSRFGQFSHDNAHSEADNRYVSLNQFIKNMGSQYAKWLQDNRQKVGAWTVDQKKQHALKAKLPHFMTFGKAVSGLYQESVVSILEKGLELYQGEDFDAFAAAAFYRLHETPFRLSKLFGQSKSLADLIKVSKKMELTIIQAGEMPAQELSEEEKASAILSTFMTSIKDGATALDDAALYNIVVAQPLNRFVQETFFMAPYPEGAKIDATQVADYRVERNKYFIDVIIEMMDGMTYTYRESTAFSRTLNFKHDAEILKRAAPMLKKIYDYELPVAPDFVTDQQVIQHDQTLEKGLKHLLDLWENMAMHTANHKAHFSEKSIADQFKSGYNKALAELTSKMPLEIGANMESFLKEASERGY